MGGFQSLPFRLEEPGDHEGGLPGSWASGGVLRGSWASGDGLRDSLASRGGLSFGALREEGRDRVRVRLELGTLAGGTQTQTLTQNEGIRQPEYLWACRLHSDLEVGTAELGCTVVGIAEPGGDVVEPGGGMVESSGQRHILVEVGGPPQRSQRQHERDSSYDSVTNRQYLLHN